jgi:hypothetical protein
LSLAYRAHSRTARVTKRKRETLLGREGGRERGREKERERERERERRERERERERDWGWRRGAVECAAEGMPV